MLTNTGTVSLVLYLAFIGLTILAMVVAFVLIYNDKVDAEKLSKMIDLFKYAIVSVAIATTTLIISDLFKEREQDVKELEYFDKYVSDVKNVDGVKERYYLSRYLAIVAPSGDLKKSWREYYDSVKIEYHAYLELKTEKQKLDTIQELTPEQLTRKTEIENKIEQEETPLASYKKSSVVNVEAAREFERMGFEFLLQKDVNSAISSFVNSENAYNSYHQVYEISRYLKNNISNLQSPDSESWRIAYDKIATEYAYGMPTGIKEKLIEAKSR